MEAKELRLGNKIYSKELDIDNACEVLQIIECDYYAIHEILRGNETNKYQSIPLTENLINRINSIKFDWVEKSHRGKYAQFTIDGMLFYFFTDKGIIQKHGSHREIKTLHGFENLFNALTDKELSLYDI
jgi:hypothetical protein